MTMVDGRYPLQAEVPGGRDVGRWRSQDPATGEPVELLALRPFGAWPPAAQAAFADLHRRLQRKADPALVGVREVLQAEDGRAWVVREPLEDVTLEAVDGPLAPGAVAAIGARLLPAVLAAGPATGGALTPRDVGLNAEGHPVLAPCGRPSARLEPADRPWVAPEVFAGGPPDGAAGLHGLGMLLYRLAAGREAFPGGRVQGRPAPPGSVRRGVPEALDQAILLLLSPDPGRRAGALPLLQQVAGPLPDLRTLPRRAELARKAQNLGLATMDPGEVKITTRPSSPKPTKTRPAPPLSPAGRPAVVLPARQLARLTPFELAVAAGFAGVSEEAVNRVAAQGMPLVLEVGRNRPQAQRRAEAIRRESTLPVTVSEPAGCAPWLALGVALSGTLLAGATALVLQPLLPLLLAGVMGAGTLLSAGWLAMLLARHGRARRAWAALAPDRAEALGEGRLPAARRRVAALRQRLGALELPVAAQEDLRGGLRDLEQHLDALGRVSRSAEDALADVDLDGLRARLQGLGALSASDPAATATRDRLARTLADLEEVEARGRRVEQEVSRVEHTLDEVAALLARQAEGQAAEGAEVLDRLVRTTRLAREAVADLEGPARRPMPRPQAEGPRRP